MCCDDEDTDVNEDDVDVAFSSTCMGEPGIWAANNGNDQDRQDCYYMRSGHGNSNECQNGMIIYIPGNKIKNN